MKNKKAFTLIELLAVIVILGVIALISTPIVLNVIDNAEKQSNRNSAYGLIDSGRLYYAESLLNEEKANNVEQLLNIWDDVVITGNKPKNGELFVSSNGNIALSVIYGDICYQKTFTGELEARETDNCSLGYVGPDSTPPTITFEPLNNPFNGNNWSKEDFYVKVNVTDTESGVDSYLWSSTTGNGCDPKSQVKGSNGTVSIGTEGNSNKICVIGLDKNGNSSDTICSDNYQLDKTAPNLSGVGDLTVSKDQTVDLTVGVISNETLSGLDGIYTYNPTNVDTSVSGTTDVTYTVKDLAGNIQNYIRKVIVAADAPTITFIVEPGKINENGWAKDQFLVTFTPLDHSGHGIKEFKWCSTTNASCDPSGNGVQTTPTGATTISTESASNRICVIATDNSEKSSTNICSDTYKLDKTAPVAGNFNVSGTVGSNGWYRSDVTMSLTNGTDSLSGHASTTIDRSNVSGNTAGTVVTITTNDLAGNTANRSQTVKIDKDAPSITISGTSVTINQGDSYNLNTGVTISDIGSSGIATKTIKNGSNVISSTTGLGVGTYTITYAATDVAGNTTSKNRTLTVKSNISVKDYILAHDSLVSGTTTGLHKGTDYFGVAEYVYKSNSSTNQPKNYINIGGTIFRILSIANDGTTKVIKKDSIGNRLFDEPGARYNGNNTFCYSGESNTYGCNVWSTTSGTYTVSYNGNSDYLRGTITQDSSLKTYLNGSYYNSLSSSIKDKLVNGTWYYGAYDYRYRFNFNQIYNYKSNSMIGLMNADELKKASTDSSCDIFSNGPPCDNWTKADSGGDEIMWMLTPMAQFNHRSVLASGGIVSAGSNRVSIVRPVMNLKASTSISSGSGTSADPYRVS